MRRIVLELSSRESCCVRLPLGWRDLPESAGLHLIASGCFTRISIRDEASGTFLFDIYIEPDEAVAQIRKALRALVRAELKAERSK